MGFIATLQLSCQGTWEWDCSLKIQYYLGTIRELFCVLGTVRELFCVLFTECICVFHMIIRVNIVSQFSTDQLVFAVERQYAVGTEF